MSIRRRSSAKASPLDTPHDAENNPVNKSKSTEILSTRRVDRSDHTKRQKRHPAQNDRRVVLTAPSPQPMTDLSLEELLDIKPRCSGIPTTLDTEHVTAQRVAEAKEALGKLESEIVTALFPPSGLPESFEHLASRLGMTVNEVRDVADNALRGLRGTASARPRLSSVWN